MSSLSYVSVRATVALLHAIDDKVSGTSLIFTGAGGRELEESDSGQSGLTRVFCVAAA
ncbi:hypothetical protein BRAO375_960006 [Bradyrhizobium sp. ORS 375]|nr:hypothetical protein BRAO375_960006 [Bradyrhizobium sp. ORS 375]